MHFQENTVFDLDLGQCHMRCCPVPFTSCDLSSCKVLSCYIQRFRRSCIYKKIQYFDILTLILGSRSHEMMHSMTYAVANFEAATLNGSGRYEFTRKYSI